MVHRRCPCGSGHRILAGAQAAVPPWRDEHSLLVDRQHCRVRHVQFRILAVSTGLLVLNIIVTILMATVAFLILQPCSRATVQEHRTNNEDSLAEARRLRLPVVLRSAARSAVIRQTSSFGSSSQCQSVINLRALAASTAATKRTSL